MTVIDLVIDHNEYSFSYFSMCLCSLPRSCATQKGYLVIIIIVQDALQYKLLYGAVKLIMHNFF